MGSGFTFTHLVFSPSWSHSPSNQRCMAFVSKITYPVSTLLSTIPMSFFRPLGFFSRVNVRVDGLWFPIYAHSGNMYFFYKIEVFKVVWIPSSCQFSPPALHRIKFHMEWQLERSMLTYVATTWIHIGAIEYWYVMHFGDNHKIEVGNMIQVPRQEILLTVPKEKSQSPSA